MGRAFEFRKERKFKRWGKMAKSFTKVGKEIALAIKNGTADPETNAKLRLAIQNAKACNMPKDTVERAIKKATSKDAEDLKEITYEGYGPYGVALFIETATDNPTRTVANIRSYLNKFNGSLATNGALDFIFQRKGVFQIAEPNMDIEEFELEMIDHGLEELFETDGGYIIYTKYDDFSEMQKALESRNVEVKSAGLQRIATTHVSLDKEQEAELEKLIAKIEDDDDVQNVYHTMKVED